MVEYLPLRSRLLLLLRSSLWRSERQLCMAVCRRPRNDDVSRVLAALMADGAVQYRDSSFVRYELTTQGRNEAKRVADARKGRKAA